MRRARARRKCITSEPDQNRFARTIARIDEENARDPNIELVDGNAVPRELANARRLSEWVLRLEPNASEILRLAARSQHICRWKIPRSDFPADRAGYHRWKNRLKHFHAELTGTILRDCGYAEEVVEQVQALNLKTHFPAEPNSRVIEDALCLVFLEFQFAELARRTEPEKVINALRKSWAKMTPRAREHALQLKFAASERALIESALAGV